MILCCGEALIDMLPRRTAEGEAAFVPCPGGAVFNTAIALGRLGARVELFTGLSTDPFGRLLERALEESHVGFGLARHSARPTTLAFVTLEEDRPRYAFHDEGSALRTLTADDLPALPAATRALFFGGISLIPEPRGTAFETLAQRAAPGHAVMLDPNIRPGFIRDEPMYRARIDRMMALADVAKVSDEDLDWLVPGADRQAQVRALIARGPRIVVVTEGAKGATGYTPAGEVFVPAPSVAVADTVGAGDTFNAGFLAALDRAGALSKGALAGLPEVHLRSALSLGVHAAAVTVSRPGANPPRAHELP